MDVMELRIGNWVNNMGIEIRFDINDWDCIVSKAFSQNPMERYKPIPLTEEWLVKLGMIREGSDWWGLKGFELGETSSGYINSVNSFEYSHGIGIRWVHQLQNLYYAFTGEEMGLVGGSAGDLKL